jgi:hypothetical protein
LRARLLGARAPVRVAPPVPLQAIAAPEQTDGRSGSRAARVAAQDGRPHSARPAIEIDSPAGGIRGRSHTPGSEMELGVHVATAMPLAADMVEKLILERLYGAGLFVQAKRSLSFQV